MADLGPLLITVESPFEKPFYWDDLLEGVSFVLPPEKITKEMVVLFGEAGGDKNSLHFNPVFAKTTVLGNVVAHGLLVLVRLHGVLHTLNFWDKTIEALCELHNVKFLRPTYFNDTVSYRLSVLRKTARSNSKKGMVEFGFSASNQHGDVVCSGRFSVLMRKYANG